MIKINILRGTYSRREFHLMWTYWSLISYFKKEFDDLKIEFKFYINLDNPKIYDCDFLFLDSTSFPKIKEGEKVLTYVDIEFLKKIRLKNNNLIWFDMRDSAGTTQFEVLPYVRKYVKRQLYKDFNFYKKQLYGGRNYTDFYNKNFGIKDDEEYHQELLDDKYKEKIVLGWNHGVFRHFNWIDFNKYDLYLENLKFFLNIKSTKDVLLKLRKYENWNKKYDIFFHCNKNIKRNSIRFHRSKLYELLQNNYINFSENYRIPVGEYYKKIINSKICVTSHGWGEGSEREFIATTFGVPFLAPNMSHIDCWPNIYIENKTYISYDLDFKNLRNKIDNLLSNELLQKELVENAQEVLRNIRNNTGKKFFIDKILEIIK
tara:strand:+ start:2897 stop:4018 length:1122 start_codon:yes stop_codon:yes gene_type:complete